MIWLSILLILSFLGTIALSCWHSVRSMLSSPDAHEDSAAAEMLVRCVPENVQRLLDAEGFRFTKAYTFHNTTFGIWMRISPEVPLRLFSILRSPAQIAYEFNSEFSDEASLTTTTTRSAFVLPRPFGSFLQCFTNLTPERLWSAHLEGERYITNTLHVPLHECQQPFLEAFRRGIVRNLSHVRSFRLWFLKFIYWYLIRRFLLQNRPICRQNIAELYARRVT
jgi:hypothetical protein